MSKPSLALILGSGFSKEFGLPTTKELSDEFYKDLFSEQTDTTERKIAAILLQYFEDVFGSNQNRFPSIEDHFTMLDLAANSGHQIGKDYNPKKLRALRRFSIHRIFRILNRSIRNRNFGENLYRDLKDNFDLDIVSLNWDIVTENLLNVGNFYYGIDVFNVETQGDLVFPDVGISLLKIHGSANWLYCDSCRRIFAGKRGKTTIIKEVLLEKEDFIAFNKKPPILTNNNICRFCDNELKARVATFSYRKDLSIIHFQTLWQRARELLSDTDIWLFIGYSMPEADYEFKHLLKTSQLGCRHSNQKKLYAVLKDDTDAAWRFQAFFGNIGICQAGLKGWYECDFADFINRNGVVSA